MGKECGDGEGLVQVPIPRLPRGIITMEHPEEPEVSFHDSMTCLFVICRPGFVNSKVFPAQGARAGSRELVLVINVLVIHSLFMCSCDKC